MYKWIPFSQLGKAGYNRGIKRAHVNKIKRDFHEDMVQPAIVSLRDKNYWIIDHQHQSQAIYELNDCDPNTLIYCDVRTGMTYEEEAELYYRLNTSSKSLSFTDKLKGLIESKDSTALKFRDIVESCGYIVGGNTSASLRALSLSWAIFNKKDGEKTLEQILKLTKATWPTDPAGVDSRIIEGIQLFLKNHGDEYDQSRFVSKLSRVDPNEIIRKTLAFYKQMDSKTFTRSYCCYTILMNNYNAGLHNKLVTIPPEV